MRYLKFACVLLTCAAFVHAEDSAEVFRFKLTLTNRADMEIDGKRHKVGTETVINYRRQRQGHDVNVICDSIAVKNTSDGATAYEGYMDRTKTVFTGPNNKKQEITTEQDAALRKTLEASFGTILAKLELDDDGADAKKSINNDPAAKDFVASGMVTNCLLFHAAYPADKPKWTRAIEYSMLGGGAATGELTYEKQADAASNTGSPGDSSEHLPTVKVTGTLKAPYLRDSFGRIMARNIQVEIQGQQTFDPATKEWISGTHTATVVFSLQDGDRGATAAKSVTEIRLERIGEAKRK